MFKIYSKGCEYALRALTHLPFDKCQEPFLAKDLCKKAKVPESSTRKIFQKLVHEGLLNAVPGPGGGYKLSMPASKITLFQIIVSVDGKDVFEKCIMGLPDCNSKKPCPVHNTWYSMKSNLTKEMNQKTLAQLIQTVKARS